MTRVPSGLQDARKFPLVDALLGRRSRRFGLGFEIPGGPLAFRSKHPPVPLSELERLALLTAMGGNSGWSYLLSWNPTYKAPPNYGAAAGGRTYPSAAGISSSELFCTDDSGTYMFQTRDAPALVDGNVDGDDLDALLEAHRPRLRKLSDGRLHLPEEEPYIDGDNIWCGNRPGSLLVFPVGDMAQQLLFLLAFLVQNGYCIHDDINGERIPGLERFKGLIDPERSYALSFLEQYALTECIVELTTACQNGALMLQAMGLGGWMYDGLDKMSVLGASGNPDVPGLGFRFDTDPRWPLPNPTGKEGVFEAYCPPHYPDIGAAVTAMVERRWGPGGPFNPDTPGPWKDTRKVRAASPIMNDDFKACVTLMGDYVYKRFGKIPGTTPTLIIAMYLQAHHLDTDFYDQHFHPGAYLETHAEHMKRWHED